MIVMLVLVVIWLVYFFLNYISNIYFYVVFIIFIYYVYLFIWCFLGIIGFFDIKIGEGELRDLGLLNLSQIFFYNKMEFSIFFYLIKIYFVLDFGCLYKEG